MNKFIYTIIFVFFFSASSAFAGVAVPGNATASFDNPALLAQGPNAVKVNFAPTNTSNPVNLTTSGLTGQAWAAGSGWMQFSGANYAVGLECDPNTQIGTFNGYGWGEGSGWINFAPTQGGLTVDANGYLNGSIWAQSTGWMNFDSTTCGTSGDKCVQFDFSCPKKDEPSKQSSKIRATCSLSSTNNSIQAGEPTTLSWNLFGTDTITINGTSYGASNTLIVSPTETTLYTGSVTAYGTTTTCNKTITVDGLAPKTDPEIPVFEYTPETPIAAELCPYFTGYWKQGDKNKEVSKIQDFLNKYMKTGLSVDGIYGNNTKKAVENFQEKHRAEILAPWNISNPSGWWYKTTNATANAVAGCRVESRHLERVNTDYTFNNKTLFGSFKDTLSKTINTISN